PAAGGVHTARAGAPPRGACPPTRAGPTTSLSPAAVSDPGPPPRTLSVVKPPRFRFGGERHDLSGTGFGDLQKTHAGGNRRVGEKSRPRRHRMGRRRARAGRRSGTRRRGARTHRATGSAGGRLGRL